MVQAGYSRAPSPGSGSSHVSWRGCNACGENGAGFRGQAPGSPSCLLPPNLGPRSLTQWLSCLPAWVLQATGRLLCKHGTQQGDGDGGGEAAAETPTLCPWAWPVHLQGGAPSACPLRSCAVGLTLPPVHTVLSNYYFRLTTAHPLGWGGDRRLCLGNNSPQSRPGISRKKFV